MIFLCRQYGSFSETDLSETVGFLEAEGYTLTRNAKAVIGEYGGIPFGLKGGYFREDRREYVSRLLSSLKRRLYLRNVRSGHKHRSRFAERYMKKGRCEYIYLSQLQNRFTIDLRNVAEERDRLEWWGEYLSDSLISLGIYSGSYLAIGESGRIYEICPSVKAYVNILGNDFSDFLLRHYNNAPPIEHIV